MNWYKLAKKNLTPQEIQILHSVIQKIMKGNRNWTPEELQLQANFPQEIENVLMQKFKEA